jgi:hypothetical protein
VAHLTRFAPALAVLILAACGGKSFEVDPDPDPQGGSGGSGQGATGNTGNVGNIGNTAGTSHGGTASAGTGQGGHAGSTCDTFNDDPGYYVNVAVINKTMAPIYLGQDMMTCGIDPFFNVKNDGGMPLSGPGSCTATCEMLQNGDDFGCPAICASPSALKLEPGETHYTQWNGLYQIQRQLPSECRLSRSGQTSCSQTIQVNPGTFTFGSVAGSSVDCSQTTGGSCGVCTATGNGGCTVPGSLISGARHNATTTVYLDSSYGVWGRPTPAPAPAPAFPNPGGDGGADIALLTVELVFAD